MTLKHLADGLMQATASSFHIACERVLELPGGTLCKMTNGTYKDLRLSTVLQMADNSGIALDTLVAWARLPEGAVLGRLAVTPTFIERAQGRIRIEKRPAVSTPRVQAFRARQREAA
jgi:hypothetical protein